MSNNIVCQPKDLLHYIQVTMQTLKTRKHFNAEEQVILDQLTADKADQINMINRHKEPKGDSLKTLSLEQLFGFCSTSRYRCPLYCPL